MGELVIGAKGKFLARTIDSNVQLSTEVYKKAALHEGTSVVETLQNCVIFNDGVHKELVDRETRDDTTIVLRQGEPMIFGKDMDKGLKLDGLKLKVVKLGNGITEKDILVHDCEENIPGIHTMLANMRYPGYPVALGVIRCVSAPTYDMSVKSQIVKLQKESKIKNVESLLKSGSTWESK